MKKPQPATRVITAEHPERGTLYAAIDGHAHHVAGRIAQRRFSAWLAPFRSEQDAKAALAAEGCPEVAQ